ncbi:hypothetical protein [Viridibacillus arvi]|uniref:hypothetical protein n=1 Tax=Viridibacillus arvi TaxID=263475 RepID=UPI0034CF7A63
MNKTTYTNQEVNNYSNQYIKKGTKTAKLDRELFFKIANGTLDISNSAINFMLFSIQFVSKDGRIYCKREEIRSHLYIQNKTFNRVINELVHLNLLSEKEGFLYSHFHVLSNGDKNDPGYVRNIKALTSKEVLSLNKTRKRFFLYAASFTSMGTIKSVSVEALYSNKYYSGVNYIESYQELAETLFYLVSKGLLVVYINGKPFDDSTKDFKSQFHAYCGYDSDKRKKRMSKTREHKIGLKINDQLLNTINPNESSKAEFRYFADMYHIYHEVMRPETIPLFIDVQNKLFELFGVVGVELYRHALVSYFATEQENVLYHDLFSNEAGTKAVNSMVDFYLIKNIEQIISKVLTNEQTDSKVETYFRNDENLAKLVSYFIEISSDDHKVMLEGNLEQHGIDLKELVQSVPQQNVIENHWLLLDKHISDIYYQIGVSTEQVTPEYRKKVIRQWASDGILARKEMLKIAVHQLKEKVLFMPKRSIRNTDVTRTIVPFYNWLEEVD